MLSRAQARAVLAELEGVPWLVANLLYGSGLRLLEALRLRVKDLALERGELIVREAKGGKDRVTMLPALLETPLRAHLQRLRAWYEEERRRRRPGVSLPHSLARKIAPAVSGALSRTLAQSQPCPRSPGACKSVLPPRLVDDEGHGVGEVEAAVALAHGDGELALAGEPLEHLARKPPRLGAEDEGIARGEGGFAVGAGAARLDAEEPCAAEYLEAGGKVCVHLQLRELLVVEAGAAHCLARELEAERLHDVERRAAVGAQADDVAGIGRDLRLEEHDVEHGGGRGE